MSTSAPGVRADRETGESALASTAKGWLGPLVVFAALAVLFVAFNPNWYGDAPYYAMDLKKESLTTSRPGHASWVPFAAVVLAALRAVGLNPDPLLLLQAMTALATAALVVMTYQLGLLLAMPRSLAMAGAALLGASSTGLLMGGSGYPSNVCALGATIALVMLFRTRDDEWSWKEAGIAIVALTLAWGAWALIVLAYPTLLAAAILRSRGSAVRRIMRGLAFCTVATATTVAFALAAWQAAPDAGQMTFLEWLQSASHNVVIDPAPLLDTLRSIFGLVRAFVELGPLGFSLKALLLGDTALTAGTHTLGWAVVLVLFMMVACIAVIRLTWQAWRGNLVARQLGLLALSAAGTTIVFCIFYGGTELHMHATAMPLLCLAFAYGAARVPRPAEIPRATTAWVAVLLVGGINLFGTVLPNYRNGGGTSVQLSEAAASRLSPGSLIVVTGQAFRGKDVDLVAYRAGVSVHNISATVRYNGAEDWAKHLEEQLQAAESRHGEVAILSDLLGEPTPGGILLSSREYPVPSLEQVSAFFSGWERRGEWQAGRFRFVNLRRPLATTAVVGP